MRHEKPNRDPKPVYAVIGDGPTESTYFESIKKEFDEKLNNCTLKPDIPKSATVKELKELIDKYKSYDKVLCIIDMDTKLRNPAEMAEYQALKRQCSEDVNSTHVHFFETHPCTELWFYYYFDYSAARHLDTYEPHVKNLIRSKIPYYEKKSPFCRHSYICKCGGDFDLAISNGRLSMKTKVSDPRDYSYSNMARFFEEIEIILPEPPKRRIGKKK